MSKNKCIDLVTFFNEAYKNYENKSYNKNSCLKKVHLNETNKINIKIPDNNTLRITLSNDDNIYKPLGFVLSNINNKIFTNTEPNDYAFKLLELILNIFESYDLYAHKSKDRISNKKLLDNININKNIESIIKIGNYIFTIPDKIRYEFKVLGENLAILKIKKLTRKMRMVVNKSKRRRIRKNKTKN